MKCGTHNKIAELQYLGPCIDIASILIEKEVDLAINKQ
jgi:hypothetical protein